MEIQTIKQRFQIIGNAAGLNRAVQKALQVAPTHISVLVSGESGVGKENIPRIIHSLSARKHNAYIAVNCGAIPEGTIDSELFGHEKGAFTGASTTRKGYFEVADGGTIFLDEVGELPLATQVRLLRVLESGEFLKVGSSQIQKTDVRIVAATNVNLSANIAKGKFREDLYYRLNTVEIQLPPLRARKEDIPLLFRKFALDFSEKYHRPVVRLDEEAIRYIQNFSWPGNIRQLRNFAEQVSVLETDRITRLEIVRHYLPELRESRMPTVVNSTQARDDFSDERDLLYRFLFEMKSDLNDLKKLTRELMNRESASDFKAENQQLINRVFQDADQSAETNERLMNFESPATTPVKAPEKSFDDIQEYEEIPHREESEESLSLQEKEVELIKKALLRKDGKRREAADELGISERTLYRKIKQYDL